MVTQSLLPRPPQSDCPAAVMGVCPTTPQGKTDFAICDQHRSELSLLPISGPFPQKNAALNTQQLVVRMFHSVGINRKPYAVSPRFLDLEEPLKSSSPMCHFTDEKTEPPSLYREVRSEAEAYSSTASAESYCRLSIRDTASALGGHNVYRRTDHMQKCNSVEEVPGWWTVEARTGVRTTLGSQGKLTGGQGHVVCTFESICPA